MRVFIGVAEVAGYNIGLKKGFEQLNVEAISVDLFANKSQYDQDNASNLLLRLTSFVVQKRYHHTRTSYLSKLMWLCWLLLETALRVILLLWAISKYDVFIYASTSSILLYFFDLSILRLLRKKIIYVQHGSDSRPPYINGALMLNPPVKTVQYCIRMTVKKRRMIGKFERYANYIVAINTIGHFYTKPLINFSIIGLPRLKPSTQVQPPTPKEHPEADAVKIAHAPSLPTKGTQQIEAIIEKLRNKGYLIDFVKIVNRPNSEVWQLLSECDFVVDQTHNDNLMTAVAVEAALMGKPTVIGSYALEHLLRDIPKELVPPTLTCHPDALEENIERLIRDKDFRLQLGKSAQQFVETIWSPSSVAERFLMLIEDNVPEHWFYDPLKTDYLYGNGISEAQVKTLVGDVIATGGRAALQLSHNPTLEQAFVDFAAGKS